MNEKEELIELLMSICFKKFKDLSYDNFNLDDIRKKLNDCKYENTRDVYNSKNRIECWEYLFKQERDRLNPPKPERIGYSNHCMTCKAELNSEKDRTCSICGYLKCSHCGSCFCSDFDMTIWNEEMNRFKEAIEEEKEELTPLNRIKNKIIRAEYILKSINIK